MKHPINSFKYFLFFTLVLLSFNTSYSQTTMYWVGGTGDWTDLSHWVKTSGGSNTTGVFPDENFNAVIDVNSGLSNTSIITIPPGDYAVNDLTISNITGFKLLFNGTSSINDVEMSVHGDLDITSQVDLDYATNDAFNNEWLFVGSGIHNIHTRNLDLQSVKFLTEGATYNLDSHLKATVQLRMYGGIWNSNGRTITAGKLLFYDDFAPPTPRLTKIFNAGTSIINCDEWKSTLAYGSLTVTGNHTIRTPKFDGSSAFENTQFSFHEIHLLEYPDNPGGGSSLVDHNNFECTDCIIENMVIEDTSRVKLAGKFTVNGELTVVNPGTSVEFSGGNGRSNEVILNGLVITPKLVDCDDARTVFTNVHNDYTSLLSNSGSLTLTDAVLVNIQASGGANFNLSNGVLQGSSSGWNLINNPTSTDYLWFSANGIPGDWDDPTRWQLLGGGSNGCVPSIVDDVYITSASKGNIRIPANFTAECRNFKWTNQNGLDLKLDGTQSLKSSLKVTGDFEMPQNATITAVDEHEILFSSNTSNTITTNGAALPDIKFIGDNGQWALQSTLNCDKLTFKGGTLNTQNQDITTDYWLSIEDNPKHFVFGSSYLTINGEFSLAKPTVNGVTVDYGTSTIDCQKLSSKVTHLYNVKLSNPFPRTLESYPYNFNSLILNSPHQITTQNDLTLNDLVLNVDGATLVIDNADDFIINGGIESLASLSTPAALKSNFNGVQAEINKAAGNICATGHISFQDINAILTGVLNAPKGIDNGNNNGINYADGFGSLNLYWVGKGDKWLNVNNWSQVDGGCPSTKNPVDAPNLVFNGNSFSSSPDTVTIDFGTTANNIYFLNSENLTVDVTISLTPNNIYVDGGYVNFVGKTLTVLGTTDILSNGFMTTNMTNYFKTNQMDASSGNFRVRMGSIAKIQP